MSTVGVRSSLRNVVETAKVDGLAADGTPAVIDARRELAESKIHDYITQTAAAAPLLTDLQRALLARLIAGGRP